MNNIVLIGRMTHVGFYVRAIEAEYEKHFVRKNGSGGNSLRPVAMFIVHRFCGLSLHKIARYFQCNRSNVDQAIHRMRGYEDVNDETFVNQYHHLLELFIRSTKNYIKRRKL